MVQKIACFKEPHLINQYPILVVQNIFLKKILTPFFNVLENSIKIFISKMYHDVLYQDEDDNICLA